ncbi:hypothetical protein PR202_gb23741 [Eleusine coracana subsp. coracana]|uniref:Uncharacterized protein n=1 Tax=Eleusine coracana subsp. coracana TaxID=191504 RepID=A0AAV5FJP0_ELECO|nr:hypothetical protein PR202_gb23741 [Eleusine coracana subsp. coracana]
MQCFTLKQKKKISKKGSASKLINLNNSLGDEQKELIKGIGFGGLLDLKCPHVPEELSRWLVSIFNTTTAEIVVPFKGTIKANDATVYRMFALPMGPERVPFEQNSGSETYHKFYDMVGTSTTMKAPRFIDEETWFAGEGKNRTDHVWLKRWLMYAICSFLCPTTCEKLTVKAYHAIDDINQIQQYNWCALVIEPLIHGIKKTKRGKKSTTGCLMFLTLLYLDSLQTGLVIDDDVEGVPRAALWTKDLIDQAIKKDTDKRTSSFGHLRIKGGPQNANQVSLIWPHRVQEFVNSSVPPQTDIMLRQVIVRALGSLSTIINNGVRSLLDTLLTAQDFNENSPLIDPTNIEEIAQSSAPPNPSTEMLQIITQALQNFSMSINQEAMNFARDICLARYQDGSATLVHRRIEEDNSDTQQSDEGQQYKVERRRKNLQDKNTGQSDGSLGIRLSDDSNETGKDNTQNDDTVIATQESIDKIVRDTNKDACTEISDDKDSNDGEDDTVGNNNEDDEDDDDTRNDNDYNNDDATSLQDNNKDNNATSPPPDHGLDGGPNDTGHKNDGSNTHETLLRYQLVPKNNSKFFCIPYVEIILAPCVNNNKDLFFLLLGMIKMPAPRMETKTMKIMYMMMTPERMYTIMMILHLRQTTTKMTMPQIFVQVSFMIRRLPKQTPTALETGTIDSGASSTFSEKMEKFERLSDLDQILSMTSHKQKQKGPVLKKMELPVFLDLEANVTQDKLLRMAGPPPNLPTDGLEWLTDEKKGEHAQEALVQDMVQKIPIEPRQRRHKNRRTKAAASPGQILQKQIAIKAKAKDQAALADQVHDKPDQQDNQAHNTSDTQKKGTSTNTQQQLEVTDQEHPTNPQENQVSHTSDFEKKGTNNNAQQQLEVHDKEDSYPIHVTRLPNQDNQPPQISDAQNKDSHAFKSAPDAPTFSLGLSANSMDTSFRAEVNLIQNLDISGSKTAEEDTTSKSTKPNENVTTTPQAESGQNDFYYDTTTDDEDSDDGAQKGRGLRTKKPGRYRKSPYINYKTRNKFVIHEEATELCDLISSYKHCAGSRLLFDNGNVRVSVMDFALSMDTGRIVQPLIFDLAADVWSAQSTQSRKHFLSASAVAEFMGPGYMESPIVEQYFNQSSANFDYVIDSQRKQTNEQLRMTAGRVKARSILLWKKYTVKVEPYTISEIWNFPVQYIDDYRQYKE